MKFSRVALWSCTAVCALWAMSVFAQHASTVVINPAKMRSLGTVDPRYLSFNVEMAEVTGGNFWKPYKAGGGLFQYRSPIDLASPRLRKLAAGLAPSYLRVSGAWQNSTWFQDDDKPAQQEAPVGFKGVLTRAEWKGVVDFSHAVDAKIVTSFAFSQGTRNAEGTWTPTQAKAWLDYTNSVGGSIAAAEFMNEPNYAMQEGAPKGYDATQYARDVQVFREFLRRESPKTIFLGPGSSSEGRDLLPSGTRMKLLASEDLLKATGPAFDAFSYHFYGAISHRCLGKTTIADTVTADWLDRTERVRDYYAGMRDKYLPGKALWLTETGEAGCGGDEFAAQFADSFRFLNQLGVLAQKGVQTVMHNTLAASDYSLLNPDTLAPKPNYWAAVLWKHLMGSVVLEPGMPASKDLRLYAQCAPRTKGGVTLLALNLSGNDEVTLLLPNGARRYTLSATSLDSPSVNLNGEQLEAAPDGSLPELKGDAVVGGAVRLAPHSITFLSVPNAHNKACR